MIFVNRQVGSSFLRFLNHTVTYSDILVDKMIYEDKTVDPRECTYRLLATSKLRKQIDRLIWTKKLELGLIKPKTDPADFYTECSQRNQNRNDNKLVHRIPKRTTKEDDGELKNSDTEKMDESPEVEQSEYGLEKDLKERIIIKIDQVETILNRSDEDQKQTFRYEDLTQLHRLLQHLDDKDQIGVAKEYFYEFLEANFRIMQQPPKRENPSLDERLRKLKMKAASDEYNSMVSNVANYVLGNKFGTKFGEDFRAIRSTLLATINALMVIIATFAFFYIMIGYVRPEYDNGKIVLYSFGASMVVAMAEIYFLIRII